MELKPNYELEASNNRFVAFKIEDTDIVTYNFYHHNFETSNSHYRLKTALEQSLLKENDDYFLDIEKHFCAFYHIIYGNRMNPMLILYGESHDYPHNEYSLEIKNRLIEDLKKENKDLDIMDLTNF